MRFHVILGKTLGDLLSLKRTVALVLVGLLFPGIMSAVWAQGMSGSPMSLQMQIHYVVDNFTILLFMWVAGLFLAISVAATAAGFISKEDTDGTLLIMVSKPISRFDIVLGKFLALVLNAMIIQTIVLLLSVLIFWAVLPIDPDTFSAVLGLVPWVLLYSLLVAVAFGSIAVALSALMKSRVKITMVVMLLIMLVFLVGMVPRTMFSGAYEAFYLYYPDLGYHLGNTFTMFLDQAECGQMMPQNQPFMTVFAGTYKGMQDSFDPDIGALPPSLELTNYVSPIMSTMIWVAISAIALGLAIWAVQRKEVH
jgi:ABC-type transport system involved in multi-copper enzyme maturation permease subunit